MAKGRKKKGGARTKSGLPSRAYNSVACDNGTPELQAKRLAAVGPGADPADSWCEAGRLWSRGVFTDPNINDETERHNLARDRYNAAVEYRKTWKALFGTPLPNGDAAGDPPSDEKIAKTMAKFDSMVERVSPDEKRLLDLVCVDDWEPPPLIHTHLVHAIDQIREVKPAARATRTRHARLMAQDGTAAYELIKKYAGNGLLDGMLGQMG